MDGACYSQKQTRQPVKRYVYDTHAATAQAYKCASVHERIPHEDVVPLLFTDGLEFLLLFTDGLPLFKLLRTMWAERPETLFLNIILCCINC
jgi:hypothetical protein